MKRIALIIAGGSGERFWPLSRPERPKQLLPLTGTGRALLEETIHRIEPVFQLDNVFIVTSLSLSEVIKEQLPWCAENVFAEPLSKNSAGAIIWGMGFLAGLLGTKDITFAILPSDHRVQPSSLYRSKLADSMRLAESNDVLVTLGIPPTRPETGYGYIERGNRIADNAFEVAQFIEKPPLKLAQKLVANNSVLWNSGVFFWRYETFYNELKRHSPVHAEALDDIYECVSQGSSAGAEDAFRRMPSMSIDHALMEKSSASAVLEGDYDWDDVGAWDALGRILPLDESGNALHGQARVLDSAGCVVFNSTQGQAVHLLGVSDLVVVATEDAILVCPKARAQDVRRLAGS